MIDHSEMRNPIIGGLHTFLDVPVVLSNSAEGMEKYPYIAYTVINPRLDHDGTHMIKDDTETDENGDTILVRTFGKIIHSIYSFTIVSDDEDQAQNLVHKAISYFDLYGRQALKDKNIVVAEIYDPQNRDNFITVDYEKRVGFDVRFRVMEINVQRTSAFIVEGNPTYKE